MGQNFGHNSGRMHFSSGTELNLPTYLSDVNGAGKKISITHVLDFKKGDLVTTLNNKLREG